MASEDPRNTLSDTTEEVPTCANCGRDADDQQPCTGCINAPDNASGELTVIWFSSLHCQMDYETAHKAACRAADATPLAIRGLSLRDCQGRTLPPSREDIEQGATAKVAESYFRTSATNPLNQGASLTSIRFLNPPARLPFQFIPIYHVNTKDLAPPPSLLVCRLGLLSALRPAHIRQAFRSTSQCPLTPRTVE